MKLLESLYRWAVGTQSEFIQRFYENENLYQQARNFWRSVDSLSLCLLLIFVVAGITVACYFYYPFNNQPRRHYRPRYWWIFLFTAGVVSFLLTLGAEYLFVSSSNVNGATALEWEVAGANFLYACVVYVIASVIICNIPIPTNAYRWFKFN